MSWALLLVAFAIAAGMLTLGAIILIVGLRKRDLERLEPSIEAGVAPSVAA
jgi:hypothetical protein